MALAICLAQFVSSCTTAPERKLHLAVLAPSELVTAGGSKDLRGNLGLAGSCPPLQYPPNAIPNEEGVGFGACFIPRIKRFHATLYIRYTATFFRKGILGSEAGERMLDAGTSCFNGQPCFGGFTPAKNHFPEGVWLLEFFDRNEKILELEFVVQSATAGTGVQ